MVTPLPPLDPMNDTPAAPHKEPVKCQSELQAKKRRVHPWAIVVVASLCVLGVGMPARRPESLPSLWNRSHLSMPRPVSGSLSNQRPFPSEAPMTPKSPSCAVRQRRHGWRRQTGNYAFCSTFPAISMMASLLAPWRRDGRPIAQWTRTDAAIKIEAMFDKEDREKIEAKLKTLRTPLN